METLLAMLLVLAVYVVLPALVGLAIVGSFLWWKRRTRSRVSVTELLCSIDADCPPGYVCVGGRCIPETEAQFS